MRPSPTGRRCARPRAQHSWRAFRQARRRGDKSEPIYRGYDQEALGWQYNARARLQLHALAYNLANLMRTLALPKQIEHRCLTTLQEKLVKIGATVGSHGRITIIALSDGCGGEIIPVAVGLGYCRSGF